mmetsp:Transcript_22525/g.45235  ORF Transcript_22525/g.45235 Transcript_22525/m.45235 type:complete len:218 (-) Transcript_22525:205-858(-)|eukprot:CAMPEP_0167790206 /NCGR_PEP_ID=MMETSP0111_2-20121227/11164_1 /TAXON_ID=91324 /ORGANISM="Lotharella globosa, Strain CCCM811" /LENGTH=217 /DNA_ID=CAMNT_0007682563 /DNA_START=27 /DNA_END=680 /DNA_ORIENTATION=+
MSADSVAKINAAIEEKISDASIIPQLEAHVDDQLDKNTYNFKANRHLLKLYKFHPQAAKPEVVGKILIKALMQLPTSDYISCLYLINSEHHNVQPVRTIRKLATLLESFDIENFWKAAEEQKEFPKLTEIEGFCQSVENFVVTILESTYCDIEVSTLETLLRNGSKDAERLQKEKGWSLTNGGKTMVLSKREAPGMQVSGSQKIVLAQVGKVLPFLQ